MAFGDGLSQDQFAAEGTGNAPVALHGDVAKHGDFFVGGSLLPPGGNQRAIMKIDVQPVVVAGQNFHFKHHSGRQGEKGFPEPPEALGARGISQVLPLKAPASHNGRPREFFRFDAPLLRFIQQKIKPGCSVFQQASDRVEQFVCVLRAVFDAGHAFLLCPILQRTRRFLKNGFSCSREATPW